MELRDYLSIRRAYSVVRQDLEASRRLTFAEFAILCRLELLGGSLNTSAIAEYQQSLRPTMTHRTKHLEQLGLIERVKGEYDKRNVVCSLTEEGYCYIDEICDYTREALATGRTLSRVGADRVCLYVDAMGKVPCMAGDLILLGLYSMEERGATISELVTMLGLLQPTVSMSVGALEAEGLIERVSLSTNGTRSSELRLSPLGVDRAASLAQRIAEIVVRRRSKSR